MYLIGSKAVLYPLLFQQFPIYVMIFNTVNTLDKLESRYLQMWCVSMILWCPGIICTVVPTGPYAGRDEDRLISPY